MAVKRVFGRVDGTDVIFEPGAGGTWNVPVPFDGEGAYVVEIIAEDEAGNQTYMAKIIFCVGPAKMCVHIVASSYFAELLEPGYYTEALSQGYYAETIEP